MRRPLAPDALTVLIDQDNVVTRGQALGLGWTDSALAARLAARRWQRLLPGVYLASSANPTWAQLTQAAVLYGGPGAVLSHQSAADLLQHRMAQRRMPRRALLVSAVGEVAAGARSPLEWRYLRQVERAHRLPVAARQVRRAAEGRSTTVSDVEYLVSDVEYLDGALVVELDGRLRHAGSENRWRDLNRDNAVTLQGARTLRYGWHDVVGRPCQVAAQVATVLAGLGWGGSPRRCGNECTL